MKAQYRTTVTFNQEDNDFLTNLAKRLGASKTEVIRRGIQLLAKSAPTETMNVVIGVPNVRGATKSFESDLVKAMNEMKGQVK